MANKIDKPKIRFKGYTDAWKQRQFGDVGSVAMCKRIFKEQTSDDGEVPFYKIGTFGSEPDAFISRELFDEYKTKYPYPNKGDILISASGSIGRTVEFTGKDEYFQDSNIVWLKHGNEIDNSFLKVLYSVVEWSCEGSTIKRLYNDNFLKTEFMSPQIDEQIKLGDYFSTLDHLITLHQHKYDKLQILKEAMLDKMFPKKGSGIPEIRFNGFTATWEQRKLGDIANLLTGFPFESKQFVREGIKLVRGMNVKRGYLDFSNELCECWSSSQGLENYLLNSGDILIQMDGALIGKSYAKITENQLPALLVQRVTRVRIQNQIADEAFVYQQIQNGFLAYIKGTKTETAVPHLSLNDIESFEIMAPSVDEQKQIGAFFESIDHLITLHQRKLYTLKNLKKAMLEKMFA